MPVNNEPGHIPAFCEHCRLVWQYRFTHKWVYEESEKYPIVPSIGKPRKTCPECEEILNKAGVKNENG